MPNSTLEWTAFENRRAQFDFKTLICGKEVASTVRARKSDLGSRAFVVRVRQSRLASLPKNDSLVEAIDGKLQTRLAAARVNRIEI